MTAGKIFLFILLLIAPTFASVPTILITSIDPQPVEPGRDATLGATLFNNIVSQNTGDFSVSIEHSFPVILKTSTNDWKSLSLCGECKASNTYFLSIDSAAVSGTYPIYVTARQGGFSSSQRVDIKVRGKPNVIFSAGPDKLANVTPNSRFFADLEVRNAGSGPARQIKIQPESDDFISLGSSLRTLDSLNATESEHVLFEFVASSSIGAGSYAIPFKITYLDYQGNELNTTLDLGVRVINKAEINIQNTKIASSSGSVITAGQPFTIVVRLENVGPGDVSYIATDILCPFGTKRAFLGQLKKNEDAPAVFDMASPAAGSYACGLNVSYKDDVGVHNFADEISVNVTQAGSSWITLPLVLAAILAYVFRGKIFPKKRKFRYA